MEEGHKFGATAGRGLGGLPFGGRRLGAAAADAAFYILVIVCHSNYVL